MKVKIQEGKLEKFACDLLVLKWVKGQAMDGSTGDVNKALGGYLAESMKEADFKGEEGEHLVFPTFGKIKAKKIMLLGLGKQSAVSVEGVRRAVGKVVQEARLERVKTVAMIFIGTGTAGILPYDAARAITEGAILGSYAFTKYKSDASKKNNVFPSELVIVTAGVHECASGTAQEKIHAAQAGIRMGEIMAKATVFARDLVNEPAGAMHPKTLSATAVALTENSDRITASVLGRAQIAELGMGAYLGVAQGSMHEPQLIHLVYQGSSKPKKVIALIGKAITFDSGGLSIKPAHAMETMKCDMAGAAAVMGVFQALSKLDLPLEIHGIMPACENMVSDTATRPGDIMRTMSGKTVEVLNTDAEGRLTLADAITYAKEKVKPDMIIDLATLTGACVVALGDDIAGVMGNDRELVQAVLDAGKDAGELMWELPLPSEYKPMLKSHIADYTNITPSRRGAGASTAGLFLQEFVGTTPWVHMDIAGPAFVESNTISYMPRGGSGYGVRTMLKLLVKLAQ